MLLIIGIALKNSIHIVTSLSMGIEGWLIFYFVQNQIMKYISNIGTKRAETNEVVEGKEIILKYYLNLNIIKGQFNRIRLI